VISHRILYRIPFLLYSGTAQNSNLKIDFDPSELTLFRCQRKFFTTSLPQFLENEQSFGPGVVGYQLFRNMDNAINLTACWHFYGLEQGTVPERYLGLQRPKAPLNIYGLDLQAPTKNFHLPQTTSFYQDFIVEVSVRFLERERSCGNHGVSAGGVLITCSFYKPEILTSSSCCNPARNLSILGFMLDVLGRVVTTDPAKSGIVAQRRSTIESGRRWQYSKLESR